MDTVTYPNDDVQTLLDERFVCLKPRIDENADLARRLGVRWTPGLVWLDAEGEVGHRNVGFFPPEEFLAESVYASGRVAVSRGDWKAAGERFEEVVARWPSSFAAPAALYFAGAAAKMTTKETEGLLERWQRLLDEYADSAWAMKVGFLRS